MSQFVSAEVESLSTQNLVQRVRTAASSGDRAAMYALQHHAARRQDEDPTGEVREAVAGLRRAIEPEAESRIAAARAALEEADDSGRVAVGPAPRRRRRGHEPRDEEVEPDAPSAADRVGGG